MSERAPITELPLFAAPDPERVVVSKVHAAAEREHAVFFDRLRRLAFSHFKGMEICSDQIRWLMERYAIDIPAGSSPNIMGTFFSGWDRAEAVMLTEHVQKTTPSKRRGSHGNLLKCWRIKA